MKKGSAAKVVMASERPELPLPTEIQEALDEPVVKAQGGRPISRRPAAATLTYGRYLSRIPDVYGLSWRRPTRSQEDVSTSVLRRGHRQASCLCR
jgi:hypothetical protein